MCHKTCLTCTTQAFTGCLTCQPGLSLSAGTCSCSWWDATCTVQSNLRQVFILLDFLIMMYLIGLMVLYVLRVRLPISYRIWNGLNAISLLFYSQVIYFDFEDEYLLKSLAVTNGPIFVPYRIMKISLEHFYPIVTILCTIIFSVFLLYLPFQIFYQRNQQIVEYLKNTILIFMDSFYFFSVKMMCFFIGKTINQAGGSSEVFIILSAVIGTIILLCFVVRFIYLYHQEKLEETLYPAPLYLYTLLSPLSFIGLPFVTESSIILTIFCIPYGLLILMVILNKGFKVFTKQNVFFYVTELVMVVFVIVFVLTDSTAQSYILLSLLFLSIILITIEAIILYRGGHNLNPGKVSPEPEIQEESKKKIIQKSSKYI